ncbi:MAG: helix-turn-helix domain-containing protein [Rubripirellula sp.]
MVQRLTDRALREELPAWGILLLESHHSPAFTMEWRKHHFIKIVYVLSGTGEFHLGDQSYEFQSGDVIVVPPGVRNRIVDDAASSLYVCCLSANLFHLDPTIVQRLECRLHRGDRRFASRVASLMRRMVHSQRTMTSMKSITMLADASRMTQIILACDARQSRLARESDDRSIVRQYIQSLPGHFFEEASIDVASQRLGIPRRTFTQLFTEITGETWLAHVRRLAIEHALHRLRETDLPITSVAFECGFNDLSTFYRQFKKQTGVSPGAYRSLADPVESVGRS